ncbi:SMI1 / KNR4 family protein [compost metagenome]
MIKHAERVLGYRLPESYLKLIQTRNGGSPVNCCFPAEEATSWAEDHIAISGICGLGGKWGIDSDDLGSRFMIEEWGYPAIGIVVCECPSAGHDAVMLDYSGCEPEGEPQVIHVDVESDNEPVRTFMAKDFASFLQGLVHEDIFDDSEQRYEDDLKKVAEGQFSPILKELCRKVEAECKDIESKIRQICTDIVKEKGYFAFHADPASNLMYDIQFWLYSRSVGGADKEQYLKDYPSLIAFGGEFSTGGYAPAFITDWLEDRMNLNQIVDSAGGLTFTPEYEAHLQEQLSTI